MFTKTCVTGNNLILCKALCPLIEGTEVPGKQLTLAKAQKVVGPKFQPGTCNWVVITINARLITPRNVTVPQASGSDDTAGCPLPGTQ